MDWIIQFDPPDDPRDYIHRVGRTARGANGKGRSLMFLQPSEVGFLKHLKEARVPVVEFEFPVSKIVNVQSQLEKLIGQNYYLNKVLTSPIFLKKKLLLTLISHSLPRTDIGHTSRLMPRTRYGLCSMCKSWTWSRLPRALGSPHHRELTFSWGLA